MAPLLHIDRVTFGNWPLLAMGVNGHGVWVSVFISYSCSKGFFFLCWKYWNLERKARNDLA